ncbi:type I polyketide synthase [Acidobacterium capsulatum]|uniref:Monooxygenase, luciferase family/oxidoreductase, short chain dehydrogenase/reductase family/phosphopantetheine attachment site domain protein n=1 Tax=Acidobacterium capsulatum (strain ATCC 51196 / DSM 11244 / BCRC 80197 / JCM 7670 / NBRC 15755 / NCIMB 13165 / 161) TaxID=240015 RepID=C1F4N8_ACIC5|nr:type I polyketide synthase [Acidobacterium capsulatum]ACO32434.1 monooxygenase, luciferase family/oxidoreductase, short chain dehydrogenase/reductase family/phosphopantetheine attachment site domain protein [Acidobacterium capsulatum ATCC 51196]
MKFSLMFFASSEEALSSNKYRLVMESARFADQNGFHGIWLPERHFTDFGSLYPNPAVLHAALATSTHHVRLMAGSVVVPLHHPIRIAEEWSVVDNLSRGRVGISFAPGWNPGDFALAPEKYDNRVEEMLSGIRTVQRLWRGESIDAIDGKGEPVRIKTYPTPQQPELPTWLTAAGNPKTFAKAGEIGANLLTHLLDQDEEQLAVKIALYREARANSGHDPSTGIVTVMLHTFVGENQDLVREQARAPFCNYISSNIGLLNGLAQSRGHQVDVRSMPAQELDAFVQFLYERFAESRGLIGTPESCVGLVERLQDAGVNEIACLLDFGPPVDLLLQNLTHLQRLKTLYLSGTTWEESSRFDLAVIQARCHEEISASNFQQMLESMGLHIAGEFDAIERIWRCPGEALGRILAPETMPSAGFHIHPAFLDACSRVLAAAMETDSSAANALYLPAGLELFRIHADISSLQQVWSHAILRSAKEGIEGDIRVYDLSGGLVLEIEGFRLHRMETEAKTVDFAPLLYRRSWIEAAAPDSLPADRTGTWLVLAHHSDLADGLSSFLQGVGDTCKIIQPEEGQLHLTGPSFAWRGVICLLPDINTALTAAQALTGTNIPLWLVTQGAMPLPDSAPCSMKDAAVWGVGRALAVEQPANLGGLIDLDPAGSSGYDLGQVLRSNGGEDMIALRGGTRYVARITRDDSIPAKPAKRLRFRKDATYLVTGGAGGLGQQVIQWLQSKGAENIAVLSRRMEASLRDGITTFRCDVTQHNEVAAVLDQIRQSMPPLRGVFHLAGMLDDARLADLNMDRLQLAGAAKSGGAWNLHELLADTDLDHFVLFSSMASLVTMPGQGSYAAANASLDALAHTRRAVGKTALSINWGPWSGAGHASTAYGKRAHEALAALGIAPLAPELALAALNFLMERDVTQAGVAQVDWQRLFKNDPQAAKSPLLSNFLPARQQKAATETALVQELGTCAPGTRATLLIDHLTVILVDILRLPRDLPVDSTQSFFHLGLDSILALEFTARISAGIGRPLPATTFFTHSTLDALAAHILNSLALPDKEAEKMSEDELAELIAQEIDRL